MQVTSLSHSLIGSIFLHPRATFDQQPPHQHQHRKKTCSILRGDPWGAVSRPRLPQTLTLTNVCHRPRPVEGGNRTQSWWAGHQFCRAQSPIRRWLMQTEVGGWEALMHIRRDLGCSVVLSCVFCTMRETWAAHTSAVHTLCCALLCCVLLCCLVESYRVLYTLGLIRSGARVQMTRPWETQEVTAKTRERNKSICRLYL